MEREAISYARLALNLYAGFLQARYIPVNRAQAEPEMRGYLLGGDEAAAFQQYAQGVQSVYAVHEV